MTQILMPKATALWLIENTALTFKQIATFCNLHILEIEGIADGEVAGGIRGADPISNGQLMREEIRRGESDSNYVLQANTFESPVHSTQKGRTTPRYTPLSRRQDRPDAIAWLVRNHPDIPDSQIAKLIGTTKPTIKAIRERSHRKINVITPTDPVALGLCSQIDLDKVVRQAAEKQARQAAQVTPQTSTSTPAESKDQSLKTQQANPQNLESLFTPSKSGA